MRNISGLNINEGGRPIARPAPTPSTIDAFQCRFGTCLPDDYIAFLRHANGGHPELNLYEPTGRKGATAWAVDYFYHLNDDRSSSQSLWVATEQWQRILGKGFVPFATDGGGNQFVFDLNTSPPAVKGCVNDRNFALVDIAPSFEAFIGGLSVAPDLV
jgi:hypothetical protein